MKIKIYVRDQETEHQFTSLKSCAEWISARCGVSFNVAYGTLNQRRLEYKGLTLKYLEESGTVRG